ncbi:MucR family transcriptional regulator [Sphingomonas sp. PAMC 26621]|uniref:MucR family transcriptional regulator n=1 Tax=Sphingomonas sp. PAMC 26621 TaxID=1112213 RepID=UPI00028A0F9D|nr:MucR family transcriptional regulator [Sphingomonas sp. PAMC 26621]
MTTETEASPNAIELAAALTIAWLSNPNTRAAAGDVPVFLSRMRDSVAGLIDQPNTSAAEAAPKQFTPAVTVRKSLASKDHIISLIDGKPYKMLRRHLSGHELTPEQYRDRYNLKADYPMVAESYSETRRAMAKRIGLGRKPGPRATAQEPGPPQRRKLKLPSITE